MLNSLGSANGVGSGFTFHVNVLLSLTLAMLSVADDQEWMRDEPTEPLDISSLTRRAIEQVRSEFTAQSWKVFERTVVDGIETSVVANELGLSTSAIRQAKSRILRRLRQQLGDLE